MMTGFEYYVCSWALTHAWALRIRCRLSEVWQSHSLLDVRANLKDFCAIPILQEYFFWQKISLWNKNPNFYSSSALCLLKMSAFLNSQIFLWNIRFFSKNLVYTNLLHSLVWCIKLQFSNTQNLGLAINFFPVRILARMQNFSL